MRKIFALLLFVSIAFTLSHAEACQGKSRSGVAALYLAEATGSNSTAKEWASHFRDLIQKTPSYCLVDQKGQHSYQPGGVYHQGIHLYRSLAVYLGKRVGGLVGPESGRRPGTRSEGTQETARGSVRSTTLGFIDLLGLST
jgi:hypothetical protein